MKILRSSITRNFKFYSRIPWLTKGPPLLHCLSIPQCANIVISLSYLPLPFLYCSCCCLLAFYTKIVTTYLGLSIQKRKQKREKNTKKLEPKCLIVEVCVVIPVYCCSCCCCYIYLLLITIFSSRCCCCFCSTSSSIYTKTTPRILQKYQ